MRERVRARCMRVKPTPSAPLGLNGAAFNITLAEGDPILYSETPATVSGFKQQIDITDWIMTRVVNTISGDAGYSQRLEFEIKATEIPD